MTVIAALALSIRAGSEDQVIFPGQCEPEISAAIINAYNHALGRDYEAARNIVFDLGNKFPDNPAGPVGETVLYQVMMLENEDYEFDAEFRDAARRAVETADRYMETAPRNDWYYTLLGATWGIQGQYFLRRDEYITGGYYGVRGLYYMDIANGMSEDNWEANMGIGIFLYYASAYANLLPFPWTDQREKGITMVRQAGERRPYLKEVSNIALFYIYVNEKDFDTAFKYIDALIEERPDFPIFYQFAGRALMGAGDYQRAYGYYLKMHEIDPGLYLPCFKLGECAMKMGRNDEAKQWFDKFFAALGDRQSIHRKPAEKYINKLAEPE
jgi:tetratricopeptide (TPR) repeat protein